jgi:hypothetical protein
VEKVRQESQKRFEDGFVGLSPSLNDVVVAVTRQQKHSQSMSGTFEMVTEVKETLYSRIGDVTRQSDSPEVEETLHDADTPQPSQLAQTSMQLLYDILHPMSDAHSD